MSKMDQITVFVHDNQLRYVALAYKKETVTLLNFFCKFPFIWLREKSEIGS